MAGHDRQGSPAGAVAHSILPQVLSIAVIYGLIFGGCCTNVYALEGLIKTDPDMGLLVTFVQMAFIAMTALPNQLDPARPPLFLKPNVVPLRRWLFNIVLFFTVNVLNNWAFNFQISVPVHIILRSGGSVTTIVVGYIWGKRYSRQQILSVALITTGVICASVADTKARNKLSSPDIATQSTHSFLAGLLILFVAQLLSAVMGLYVQSIYSTYGSNNWRESLFYCHFLGIPLFLPWAGQLHTQYLRLAASPPWRLSQLLPASVITAVTARPLDSTLPFLATSSGILGESTSAGSSAVAALGKFDVAIPSKLLLLAFNALTQYLCIRGVNRLAATSSALTVTIVLNVRKLVSLIISIKLFGNDLPLGVVAGAVVVFAGSAVYGWDSKDKSRGPGDGDRGRAKEANGELEGGKNGKLVEGRPEKEK